MTEKKEEILRILREEKGRFVSGQKLCEELSVSRTAVWKYMNQLKEEGYVITSVSNKGYALAESPDILSEWEIASQMETRALGRKVLYYTETDSTNLRIKQAGEEEAVEGTLAVAESQNAGRGRRGRSWNSKPGKDIFMSLLLRPECEAIHASSLTLVAGLSVAVAIREITGAEAEIKWPNDIVLHGKKICGILTEMSSEESYMKYVTVGIGINVNTQEFPEEIHKVATSLFLETGKTYIRSHLIAGVMKHMETYYGRFCETKDLRNMLEEYNQYLVNKGKEVAVLTGDVNHPQVLYQGIALGINEKGMLLVQTEDETIREVVAGEVSVRGVYGYV